MSEDKFNREKYVNLRATQNAARQAYLITGLRAQDYQTAYNDLMHWSVLTFLEVRKQCSCRL